MTIHVQVIIVGLTTLLNLQGAADLSDPSVVAPEYAGHKAFIAYNIGNVKSDASNLLTSQGYSSLSVDKEKVTLGADLPGTPIFNDDTFDCLVAHFSQFSDLSKFEYDNRFVPPHAKDPDGSVVAMYVPLGGGSVTAGDLTASSWEFLEAKEGKDKPHKRSARKFARSVTYSYDLPQGTTALTVTLKKLGDDTTRPRTVTFKPVGGGDTITIYLGNSADWQKDVTQTTLVSNGPSLHFHAFYNFVKNAEIHYIPFPKTTKSPDLGYCGPTGLP